MVTRDSSKANQALGGHCFVASLESRDLLTRDYTHHLSINERTNYMALPTQTRKREWLAGRLAAKYIFLNRLETLQVTQDKGWRPTLTRLSSDALDHYPAWMYRQVEVVTAGEKPCLMWCGQVRPESISLSHSGGMSCASLTFGQTTAIDIETIVPRFDAFYRINFSNLERRWAMALSQKSESHLDRVSTGSGSDLVKPRESTIVRKYRMLITDQVATAPSTFGAKRWATGVVSSRSDWFFTFLWTVKESVLKLGCFPQASIWNLPGIEIDGLPVGNNLGPCSFSNTFSSEFAVFKLSVKEHSHVIPVQVAVTGTRSLVLTVVNPLSVE